MHGRVRMEDGSCTNHGGRGEPLSFFFSANAGHFANATTHRSTRTPPGTSAINENAGLNPVLLKSFQNGATKKIANDITQGMISDPSTWPPIIVWQSFATRFFVHSSRVTCLPLCCPALFNKLSGLCIDQAAYHATLNSCKKGNKEILHSIEQFFRWNTRDVRCPSLHE
jgi:hypothetical protein